MSETSNRLGVFLPGVSRVGAFQAKDDVITQKREIGWAAAQSEDGPLDLKSTIWVRRPMASLIAPTTEILYDFIGKPDQDLPLF